MTKLPAENQNVSGLDGPEYPHYKVGPLCAAPGCSRLADHSHHIWRRSFLAGDYAWVKLWDGAVVGNLVGLCWRCHQEITENRASIQWRNNHFYWEDHYKSAWLDPQPPIHGVTSNVTEEHPKGPAHSERCPTCKRVIPSIEKTKTEGKRPRKNWTVSVPVDHQENGANVLDTLLKECAYLFGHDETKELRYFTLSQALALVVQNGHKMMADE